MVQVSNSYMYKDIAGEMDRQSGVNVMIGESGKLHIERKLPFLLVYRLVEEDGKDEVIEKLLQNEASYFVIAENEFSKYQNLLRKVVKKLSDEFGAFLLIEVWQAKDILVHDNGSAQFNLYGPRELPDLFSPLKNYLEEMKLAGFTAQVKGYESDLRHPRHLQPLIERKTLKQMECLLLGLEIEPFYRDAETGKAFPLLERIFYAEFSSAFRKAAFDFVKVQANHKFTGFNSLARREINPAVWEIDKQLVEIDSRIKFLMLVSPVNGTKAWKSFRNSGYKDVPVFHYRMLPDDPELLKRSLYNIKLEEIEDPTLGFLFREKRSETDKMLTMLGERESTDFLYGSLQLFGGVEQQLLSDANNILDNLQNRLHENHTEDEYYDADGFAELARNELKYLQSQWAAVEIKVEIKNTIDSMMVDKGVFYIPRKSKVLKQRAEALIQHEIGTHVLTYYNGKNQPLKLLSSGISGYEELQEGIAVLAEYLCGGLSMKRIKLLAGRVVAVDSLINDRNFISTFELLVDRYGFIPRDAFFITTRVYRGGGLTKDAIYLRGFIALIKYLKEGNKLEPLLIGKIRQSYIPVIEELVSRKILKPLPIRPRYLLEEEPLKRLADLKNKKVITELINLDL